MILRRRWWPAAVLAGALLAAAGCASAPGAVALPPAAAATVHPSWRGCSAVVPDAELELGNDRQDQGRVPAGFVPVRAVTCGRDGRDGVERTTPDLADLLTELARPSETVPDQEKAALVCPAIAWFRPWLFLLDAEGRWMAALVPTGPCGLPLDFGERRPDGQQWPESARYPLDVAAVRAAERVGCAKRSTGVAAVITRPDEQPAVAAPVGRDPLRGRSVRLCRYGITAATNPEVPPEGHFRSGTELPAAGDARRVAVAQGLASAPAATDCRTPATRFVEVTAAAPEDATAAVTVELDGCQRILTTTVGPVRAAAASPELVAALS
jgi:hypothetical protein